MWHFVVISDDWQFLNQLKSKQSDYLETADTSPKNNYIILADDFVMLRCSTQDIHKKGSKNSRHLDVSKIYDEME